MSMRIDSSIARRLVDRWDREETRETVSAMSQELSNAAKSGKFGHSDAGVKFGYSLAASVKDPIFLDKVATLLNWRFDV